MATTNIKDIIKQLEAAQESAMAANELRYQQAMAIYDEVIRRYQPGGVFEQATLSQLEKQKTRDVASGMQSAVSSGLANTTTPGNLGRAWEEQVGAPARLSLQDILMQRLSGAEVGKAGFIERATDEYPSYMDIASLAAQYYSNQGGGGGMSVGGGGGGGGGSSYSSFFDSGNTEKIVSSWFNKPTYGDGGKAAGEGGYEGTPSKVIGPGGEVTNITDGTWYGSPSTSTQQDDRSGIYSALTAAQKSGQTDVVNVIQKFLSRA